MSNTDTKELSENNQKDEKMEISKKSQEILMHFLTKYKTMTTSRGEELHFPRVLMQGKLIAVAYTLRKY